MKKKLLVSLSAILLLTSCRTNGRQIDANYDVTTYNDYMTADNRVDQLNYFMTNDEKDLSLLGNLIDGLVETDKYGNLKPALSQDVGVPSSNNTVWEFSLRDNVPWVNALGEQTGEFVKADDFVCGIQYVLDHKNSAYFDEVTSLIKNAKEYSEGKVEFGDVGVEAVNDFTVRYTLKEACPYFNTYLLNGGFYPVCRSMVNDMGDQFATSPAMMYYNGAYYLDSYGDAEIKFKKNTHYWEVGQVSFESGTITLVKDGEEALNLFKKGKLSYAYIDSSYAETNGKSIDSHLYMSASSPEVYAYLFNYDTKNEQLKIALQNENFRKALLYGLDVQASYVAKVKDDDEEQTDVVKQDTTAQSTIVPSEFVTTSTGVDYLSLGSLSTISASKNFDMAKSQLAQAAAMTDLTGKVTFPVEIAVPICVDDSVAEAEFNRITSNIDSTFVVFKLLDYTENEENKEIPSLKKVVQSNEYGMILMSLQAQHGDPSTYLEYFTEKNGFNATYMNMKDETYDGLFKAASAIVDADSRLRALAECEAYLINKGFVIPFSHGKQSYKVSSINDYSTPRGTYGLARFKLKGVNATENAVTITERDEMKAAYEEAKNAAV